MADSVDGTDDGADHKNNNQDDRCVGMYHNTGMNVIHCDFNADRKYISQ